MAEESGSERRGSERLTRTFPVEVRIDDVKLLGPSANLSKEGIYFLAEASIPVTLSVNMDGKLQEMKGRMVRVGSVNQKTIGVAIQFDNPISENLIS